jgi:glycosyltransferase involved in cell wall biosynthesis
MSKTISQTVTEPQQINVAVRHLGGRADKLMTPLKASTLNVDVDPGGISNYDVLMLDQPRYKLAKEVATNRDVPTAYRVRGNIWKEMDIWRFGRTKKFVAENFIYPELDGAVAVDNRLANIFNAKTGVSPVGSAGLAKDLDEWADAEHKTSELELITLSNFNYKQKVGPLKAYIPVINEFLKENGGHWYICGEGIYDDDFAEVCEDFPHVSFEGYIDPHEYLPNADAMIHVSEFDAYPNAVLEGYASNLPVLTNSFIAFQREYAPNITHAAPVEMVETLRQLEQPEYRRELGQQGKQYIREYHTPEYVGKQYERYFRTLVHDSE